MQIFARMPSGNIIRLRVQPTDAIVSVKKQIEDETGIDASSMWLIHPFEDLEDGETLSQWSIENEATLERNVWFQICVHTLSGNAITLGVAASDTIERVKRRLCSAVGIPLQHPRLVRGTQELEDHCTLGELNLMRASSLQLVVR